MKPPFEVRTGDGLYVATRPVSAEDIVAQAKELLARQLMDMAALTDPKASRDFLQTHLMGYQREVFACIFLDTRHRVIAFEKLFYGTIDACSVHPREVLRRALHHNAAAVVLAHNHPSGDPTPSRADETLTRRLKESLALVEIRVLDHLVVGDKQVTSLLECGLM